MGVMRFFKSPFARCETRSSLQQVGWSASIPLIAVYWERETEGCRVESASACGGRLMHRQDEFLALGSRLIDFLILKRVHYMKPCNLEWLVKDATWFDVWYLIDLILRAALPFSILCVYLF